MKVEKFMNKFNTYDEFKEKIINIIEQRTDIWCDEILSENEFKEKDNLLEREQWEIFNNYPEYHEKWLNELMNNFIL